MEKKNNHQIIILLILLKNYVKNNSDVDFFVLQCIFYAKKKIINKCHLKLQKTN